LTRAKNNELMRQARLDAGLKIAGAAADKKFGSGNEDEPNAWDNFRNAYNKAQGVT